MLMQLPVFMMFQSLIGIKKNCDPKSHNQSKKLLQFQSLIGIKKNCDKSLSAAKLPSLNVSIPDRD